jgi:RNA exonuclease NGL2
MLSGEILAYSADILCLQEVDKLDTLLPAIESTYSHIYASGRSKKHGCMILYNKSIYEEVSRRTVYYDEEDVRQGIIADDPSSTKWRRGLSRATKNIALLATLRRKDNPAQSIILATTHLFWHPA